jgi:hypothetical protein
MPGDATKRACITLKSRQLEALKGLSRETGAPVAELTRRAVDAFLTAQVAGEDRQPDQVETGSHEISMSSRSTANLVR